MTIIVVTLIFVKSHIMEPELLQAATEFNANFLDKYPTVEQPFKQISDFSQILNKALLALPEHTEAINSVLTLLTNSNLEKFAEADLQKDTLQDKSGVEQESASQDATEIEQGANEAVYGDGGNLAGLKESVSRLIAALE